mmetsp:Transcript_5482/g.11555  ORF Transcript_5482/g.11555 Transcript_5482/m.11555 type:complete len:111 (+) Transcript_5482:768-1100(+)
MRFITDPLVHLLGSLPFSRKLEYEADHIGLVLMTDACFDPRASPAFFARLGEVNSHNGNNIPQYLSTHPNDHKRVQYIESLIPDVEANYGNNCTFKHRGTRSSSSTTTFF